MQRNWVHLTLLFGLLLLPLVAVVAYREFVALPPKITLAGGPAGGRYHELMNALAAELVASQDVSVSVTQTTGTPENLRLLATGQVDFALFQAGPHPPALADRDEVAVAFVANLYSESVNFIVRRDAGIRSPADLAGRNVALGEKSSGSYAMSRLVLSHFGCAEEEVDARLLTYPEILTGFADGSLDAALLTAGAQAPILGQLAESGMCHFLPIPFSQALATKHVSLTATTIPQGLYRAGPHPEPPQDLQTVSVRAQLITRGDVSQRLVGVVTHIVSSQRFVCSNDLAAFYAGGVTYARSKPAFPIHPGAAAIYEPELRPFLNPDFVEATEGMRSFVVSVVIAGYLGFRWWRRSRNRKHEHILDHYIRSLLEIERQQVSLDVSTDPGHAEQLENLLDDVTRLRGEALQEFSAHDLNEDRAADCFLELSHAVSAKIDAKISRQHLDQRFNELLATVRDRDVADTAQ